MARSGILDERYPRLYKHLKHFHGAAKAVSILLDATRHDTYALRWIRTIRHWDTEIDSSLSH